MGALKQLWNKGNNTPMPDYLKNCVFYFDKNLSTVTDTGTMVISDLSACGNNLKQSTSGEKPTFNTSTGLTFDNADDNLKFDTPIIFNPLNFTWYFRWNRATAADDTVFMMDLTDPFYNQVQVWLLFRATSVNLYFGSGSISITGLNSNDISGDKLYKITGDGTNIYLYSNGTLLGQASNSANWGLRYYCHIKSLGSYNASYQRLIGSFSQLALYNKYLTTGESTIVEAQLTNKTIIPNYTKVYVVCKGLFGQSNAAGRHLYTEFATQYQNVTKSQVLDLSNGIFKVVGQGGIDHGEGKDGTKENYKSFELPYSYLYSGKIFWLKHAIGSTFLEDQVSTANWSTTELTTLVNALFYRNKMYYKYFIDLVKSLGYNPVYNEDIWMQGEQDATTVSASSSYSTNLIAYINAWRTYTGLSNQFTIMRIYGPPDSTQVYYLDVQTAVSTVKSSLFNIQIISTNIYPKSDVAHYAVSGIIQGGSDLFNKNYMP